MGADKIRPAGAVVAPVEDVHRAIVRASTYYLAQGLCHERKRAADAGVEIDRTGHSILVSRNGSIIKRVGSDSPKTRHWLIQRPIRSRRIRPDANMSVHVHLKVEVDRHTTRQERRRVTGCCEEQALGRPWASLFERPKMAGLSRTARPSPRSVDESPHRLLSRLWSDERESHAQGPFLLLS